MILSQNPSAYLVRENEYQKGYAKALCTEYYVARKSYFDQLNSFVRSEDDRGMVVIGEPGAGKSALLANWVARWRLENPNDFVFEHYPVRAAPQIYGVCYRSSFRRFNDAVFRWCGEVRETNVISCDFFKEITDAMCWVSYKAQEMGVRAVIVFDSVQSQFNDTFHSLQWQWIPPLRLVVSTNLGEDWDNLQARGWPYLMVEPLTVEERREFISRYTTYSKHSISMSQSETIVNASSNPLFLKTVMDEAFNDSDIADYLSARDLGELYEKILSHYERDIEPKERPGLLKEALSLIWAACWGLKDEELLEVLSPVDQKALSSDLWRPLKRALGDKLLERDGVLSFAHESFRHAVEIWCAQEPGKLRWRLANYFEQRPVDSRQIDELPWLLRAAEAQDRLGVCLLDIDRLLLLFEWDRDDLYWHLRFACETKCTNFEATRLQYLGQRVFRDRKPKKGKRLHHTTQGYLKNGRLERKSSK